MKFTFKKWEWFCKTLAQKNQKSIPAREVFGVKENYVVLKHDVETNVKKAYQMAVIEHRYGHRGSYYVQAYLLENKQNIELLKNMQNMGHEITYHHDVMDSSQGNLQKAMDEFRKNKALFEKNGFQIKTVCQHGNPLIERKGYTSNRDFFRSSQVQKIYPEIADIMVDFPGKANTAYEYYSDAGRKFRKIFDPFTNDIVNSDDKNTIFDNLEDLFKNITDNENHIISVHPHRWSKNAVGYASKNAAYQMIIYVSIRIYKLPLFKNIMSRYYYLAKKL